MEIGSIAEWVTVLVTFLGFVILALTFKSQIKVQLDQQEITRIEQANFRLQFLPKLNGNFDKHHLTIEIANNPLITMITYKNPRNKYDYVNLWHHYGEKNALEELMPGMDFYISITDIHKNNNEFDGLQDSIYIFFLDSQENLYEQTIAYNWNTQVLVLKYPKFIKKVKGNLEFKNIAKQIAKGRSLENNKFI